MLRAADVILPSALEQSASKVVKELLSSEIHSSTYIRRGMMTFKCHVQTVRGESFMVRFYPEPRSGVVNQEPDLLRRCREAGLPVPEVISDSRSGPKSPLAYIVYSRIAGDTLKDALPTFDVTQSTRAAEGLAQHLARLSEMTFSGTGALISGFIAGVGSWSDFVSGNMKSGVEAIHQHRLLPAPLATRLDELIRLGPPAPYQLTDRLVWGDINYENILVSAQGNISGLIDFESCLSGDPLATLGYLQAANGTSKFYEILLDAWPYKLQRNDELMIAWYALLRAMRLARYLHRPLPTGQPRDPLLIIFPGIMSAVQMLGDYK